MCFIFLVLSVDDSSGEQTLGRTDEVGRRVFVGARCCVPDPWDRSMSPGCIAPPDVSDSDGYCGPGIRNFLLFSIPLATPPSPCDKRKRCHVS